MPTKQSMVVVGSRKRGLYATYHLLREPTTTIETKLWFKKQNKSAMNAGDILFEKKWIVGT